MNVDSHFALGNKDWCLTLWKIAIRQAEAFFSSNSPWLLKGAPHNFFLLQMFLRWRGGLLLKMRIPLACSRSTVVLLLILAPQLMRNTHMCLSLPLLHPWESFASETLSCFSSYPTDHPPTAQNFCEKTNWCLFLGLVGGWGDTKSLPWQNRICHICQQSLLLF